MKTRPPHPRHAALLALALGLAPAVQAQTLDLGRMLRGAVSNALSPCPRYLEWVRTPVPATAAAQPQPGSRDPRERSPMGLDARALHLVSDEVFSKHFVKTYEQMTIQELREFQRAAPQCQRDGGFTPQEWQTVRMLLDEHRHTALVRALAAERARQQQQQQESDRNVAELDAVQQELARAAGEGASLDRLRALRERAKAVMPKVPPQRRAAYEQAATVTLQEAVPAAMRLQAKEALAEARTPEALPRLIALRRQLQYRADFGVALGEDDPAIVELKRRELQLAGTAAESERAALRALPDGLPGLEAGVRWKRQFDARWGTQRDTVHPELLRVLDQDFYARREPLLQRLRPALVQEVNKAASLAEAQGSVARFTVPNEARLEPVQAMEQAVSTRIAQIERNLALGRPTAAAEPAAPEPARPAPGRAPQAAPTAHAVAAAPPQAVATSPGEPTEDVMYDLVRTKFEAAAERMRGLNSQCSRGGSGNPINAMMCMSINIANATTGGASGQAVKIVRFSKIGCEKSPSRPGYNCEYEIKTDNPMNKQMENLIGFQIDEAGFGQGRFVRNREGRWLMITGD